MLTYYINGLGIKANHVALHDYLFQRRAMQSRDFDILVQEVDMAQAPFGLYPLLHSSLDQEWANVFSSIHDLGLDADLEQLWSGLDLPALQRAAKDAQDRLSVILPYVPDCSVPVFTAIKWQWDETITMPGFGVPNFWTYQALLTANNYPSNVLRITAPGGFNNLNPLVADSFAEWSALQQIFNPPSVY